MGDSCQLKGTELMSPMHIVLYGDKICRPINHTEELQKFDLRSVLVGFIGSPNSNQRTYHLEECQVRLFSVTGRTTSAPIGWCVILPLSPTVSLLFCIHVGCHTQTVQS